METTVRSVGNSLGVIIPGRLVQECDLVNGSKLSIVDGKILLAPENRQVVLDRVKRAIGVRLLTLFSLDKIKEKSLFNLNNWKSNDVWCQAYDEWTEIINSGDDVRMIKAMISEDDHSNRLRQSMPFVGLLPPNILGDIREKERA